MEYRIGVSGIFLGIGVLLGTLAWTGGGAEYPEPVSQETAGQEKKETAPLSLHALSAVLMDGDSGRILYEKDGNTVRPMASTTKIMTCILALENGNLQDFCTVSEAAAAQPKVHLGAPKGTRFRMKDLLYSLMLESHNDSAVMIAEQVAGSAEAFAAMMNQKARDLGCENTTFLTPNGLDKTVTAPDGTQRVHSTTAADLARIMRYCIKESPMRDAFLEITRTANYSFADETGTRSYSCVNHNALLSMMSGALTGKTGFTGGAGYSYVAALEDQGRTYVLALLGCGWPPHKTYKWADSRALFSYGKEAFYYREVFREPVLPSIPVTGGISDTDLAHTDHPLAETPVTAGLALTAGEEERTLKLLLRDGEEVSAQLYLAPSLPAPVRPGQLAGCLVYTLDGENVGTFPVCTTNGAEAKTFGYALLQLVFAFFLP